MTIEAKVIADSTSAFGPRLTTFQLKYPRFIHAEFMTHRLFSRNASSSRAIPVQKQIDMIREDTAMPSHWGKNQSGMQAEEETDAPVVMDEMLFGSEVDGLMEYWRVDAVPEALVQGWQQSHKDGEYLNAGYAPVSVSLPPEVAWTLARDRAIEVAQAFHDAGYHKQIVNRILEPFSHISVVCTSTDYDNFYWLRRHKDAQPEIKILADAMFTAAEQSEPRFLNHGEWHVPYVLDEEFNSLGIDDLIKVSVARCARVSYLTHDGKAPDLAKDLALYERLVGSEPLHASPAEHQATPDQVIWDGAGLKAWERPNTHGNLTGYRQYRKLLSGENYCVDTSLNTFE